MIDPDAVEWFAALDPDDPNVIAGAPGQVIDKLASREQTDAAAICAMLTEFEQQVQEYGWNQMYRLFMMFRDLPPTDLADRMDADGMQAMVLGMTEMPMPRHARRVSPFAAVQALAEVLTEHPDEATSAGLLPPTHNLVAWVLCYEAFTTLSDDDPREVPSAFDPENRIEIRIVMAVDRVGYRYELMRTRTDDSLLLHLDLADVGQRNSGGRTVERLHQLMEATPIGEL